MNSLHRLRATTLVMLVVYDHPADFPDHFVVRAQWPDQRFPEGLARGAYGCLYDTLAEAMIECRNHGLTFLQRHPTDPPAIVGVWL